MKEKFVTFIKKHACTISSIALVAASMSCQACRCILYEPEIPDSVKEFVSGK